MMTARRPKALVSWSTGKDCAYAYWQAQRSGEFEIVGVLTTVTTPFGRVSMHGVRESLLDRQCEELGLPCWKVGIPSPCPNEVYEREFRQVLEKVAAEGITHFMFGDLFLEDIRAYRERQLTSVGMFAVFPLWQRNTNELAREMLTAGVRATTTCVELQKLPSSFAGRPFDEEFLGSLPDGIDACGENGEFHTFVTDGPMFRRTISVRAGEVVVRDGFAYADLLPS